MPNSSESYDGLKSAFALVFILQLISSAFCGQMIILSSSELTATMPFEYYLLGFLLLALVNLKITQFFLLTMLNFDSYKVKRKTFDILLMLLLATLGVICCSLYCCKLIIRKPIEDKYDIYTNYNSYNLAPSFQEQLEKNSSIFGQFMEYIHPINNSRSSNELDFSGYQRISMSNYDKELCYRDSWDVIQDHYKCCGSTESKDWLLIRDKIPLSCCTKHTIQILNNGSRLCNINDSYEKGCKNILNHFIIALTGYCKEAYVIVGFFEFLLFGIVLTYTFLLNCVNYPIIELGSVIQTNNSNTNMNNSNNNNNNNNNSNNNNNRSLKKINDEKSKLYSATAEFSEV